MDIFHDDIRRLAKKNESFRKVITTGPHTQVLVMHLQPGEDVGEEVHVPDQLLLVVKGEGQVIIEDMVSDLAKDDLVLVPGGTRHDIRAARGEHLKLVVVYTPPLHLVTTEHVTKADAMVEAAKDAAIAMVPSAF